MPRMWMVPTEVLCSQHLVGEHYETHMIYGGLTKNRGKGAGLVRSLANAGKAELAQLQERHDALADELIFRGGNHNSPLIFEWEMFQEALELPDVKVDVEESLRELESRCPKCRANIAKWREADGQYRPNNYVYK